MNSNEARDALHVLRTFAYLHCEDIRFEFVKRAITNAANDSKSPTPHTWSDVFSPDIGKLYTYLHKRWSRPILPDVFSETHLVDDPKLFRIRAALGLLQNMSLISHNTRSDTYTMHLLVHAWARKVPGIGLAEQAAWAECAATLLSNCISLASPSDSDKKSEGQTDGEAMRATERKKQEELKGREELRKQLLPHVDHVRDRQSEIRKLMSQNRESCKRPTLLKPWQDLDGVISRDRALMFAKFSIVYLEHGRFSEAEYLQSAVMEYTMRYLGPQHESTRRITLLLADTYIHISKAARAEELQTIIINACTSRHDKLVAQQKLAESRRFQGHLTDARRILREVVAGLTAELGELHEDTLDAIDALGRTLIAFYDDKLYLEARELHRKAYNGIRKIHGDDAIKTLLFCENFCMTAVSTLEPAHLSEALGMMEHVLQTRKEKLGREHAYTLLAMVNLARVQSGMGNPEAAEKHILHGLPIAQRNLGEDHIAYLWGRYELAKVMIQQSRWRDAEGLLKDNIQRQKKIFEKRGGHHPDVIGGLIALATALNALGRHSECERVVEEALHTLTRLSNADEDHPLATKLKTSRDQWRRTRDDASVDLGVGQTA
jgi:tetratricopeptide (TPR) repeat protein